MSYHEPEDNLPGVGKLFNLARMQHFFIICPQCWGLMERRFF